MPSVPPSKSKNVIAIIGVVVLLGGVVAIALTQGKKQTTEPAKTAEVSTAKKPGGAAGKAPGTVTPPPSAPSPLEFQKGSDGAVDGWTVDSSLKEEMVKELKRVHTDAKGDVKFYASILERFNELFPVIADCLRSDDEAVAKEAGEIVTNSFALRFKANYGTKLGNRDLFIADMNSLNDPAKRRAYFQEMREAWEKAKGGGTGAAATPGGTALPVGTESAPRLTSSYGSVIDALRRGGDDREKMIAEMKLKKKMSVKDILIPALETEDVVAGRACGNVLNELTGANIDVPKASEYGDGKEFKKKWKEWFDANGDKLQ
jgi:hypothetical protein